MMFVCTHAGAVSARSVSACATFKLSGSRGIVLNSALFVKPLTFRRRGLVDGPGSYTATTNQKFNFLVPYLGMRTPAHIFCHTAEATIILAATFQGWQDGLLWWETIARAEPTS